MDPLLEQFLGEARENLSFIDQNIESIGGDDPELLNSVFRAAHTLKGGSGIVGFESVKEITHHAEDLLDMLRGGKLEFAESMIEALYDAFDEVLNLIEAAEESGGIVEADEERVNSIVAALNEQMGKDVEVEQEWQLPFTLLEDKSQIINFPLHSLSGASSIKLPFNNTTIDENFVGTQNFYGVLFDIDESCMVYGNDPIYALSLLGKNVLGISSCMTNENSKAILSGTEDEDGLLLKTQLVAFVYGTYGEIEEALFNFSDEMELLALDINTLLQVDMGDSGHPIDSLKELSDIADDFDLQTIVDEVKNSLELVGKDTIQYAQLQRFLDISGLIKDEDTSKLGSFFKGLHKGEKYSNDLVSTAQAQEEPLEQPSEETPKEDKESQVDTNEHIELILQNMYEQQYRALDFVETASDFERVKSILAKMKKYLPDIPSDFQTKEDLKNFIAKELGKELVEVQKEEIVQEEKVVVAQKVQEEKVQEKTPFLKEETKTTPKIVTKATPTTHKKEEKKSVVGKTVKIDQESIDSLMNVVG